MSKPLVFEVEASKRSCAVCVDGILFPYCPYSRGSGKTKRSLSYEWKDPYTAPPQEILKELALYHAAPECSPENHKWFEEKERAESLAALEVAARKFAKADARPPGWSIELWRPKP